MSCKLEPMRGKMLLTRAMILFILVGVATFALPAQLARVGLQPPRPIAGSGLPLKMAIDATP